MHVLQVFLKKTLIKCLIIILVILGSSDLVIARARISLTTERTDQQDKAGLDSTPLTEVLTSTKPNKYTQTEAHLSLKSTRDLVEKAYGSKGKVVPYLNIISSIIANEAKHRDTHYAFYHTTGNEWRLAQDVFGQLYAAVYNKKIKQDFKFLRFDQASAVNATAQNWLINELTEKGLVDDNKRQAAAILLSVNLSVFANVGYSGECSWDYFIKDHGHREPSRKMYEDMLKRFGFSNKYVDDVMALAKIYETPEDTLLQILVPKKFVDQIGYLAWIKGIPAHEDTIELIKKAAGKTKSFSKRGPEIEKLMKKFEEEGEKNPIYKDMLESVKAGDFSLEDYLRAYCNKPWELKNINDVTARLLFTPDVLLNPESGVKFVRFSTASREAMKRYHRELNIVIDKILAEKKDSGETSTAEPDPFAKPLEIFNIPAFS